MPKLIAIGGIPGTGKTTLVKALLATKGDWQATKPVPLLDALYSPSLDLYILGRYPENEVFGGTDRLSMAVQPKAKAFVESTNSHVLFEGDRLFNLSFLTHVKELGKHGLHIVSLETEETELPSRYASRGSNQSEKFIKGRRTKVAKVLSQLNQFAKTFPHNEPTDTVNCVNHILEVLHD